jgi:hypothetical protein
MMMGSGSHSIYPVCITMLIVRYRVLKKQNSAELESSFCCVFVLQNTGTTVHCCCRMRVPNLF